MCEKYSKGRLFCTVASSCFCAPEGARHGGRAPKGRAVCGRICRDSLLWLPDAAGNLQVAASLQTKAETLALENKSLKAR